MISDRTTAGLPSTGPEELARYVPSFLLHRYSADPAVPAAPHSETFRRRGPVRRHQRLYRAQRATGGARAGGGRRTHTHSQCLFWPAHPVDPRKRRRYRQVRGGCVAGVLARHRGQTHSPTRPVAPPSAGWQSLPISYATPPRSRSGLSLHVGIGAGEVRAATVGGTFNRWEVVVMGPAVLEATKTAAHAEPGQIVFGPGAGQFLTATCRSVERTPEVRQLIEVLRPLPPQPLGTVELPPEAAAGAAGVHSGRDPPAPGGAAKRLADRDAALHRAVS